jgi:predicted  nucleic acid-binding Zn-ribbon protein
MHKCVRCGMTYLDNDNSIMKGCPNCGSIFFLFIKNQKQEKEAEEIKEKLKEKEISLEKEIEKQIKEKKREIRKKREKFGVETIRIPREGVYEINIKGLMQDKPLIVLEKGKIYLIHLPSLFEKMESEQPLSLILEDFFS